MKVNRNQLQQVLEAVAPGLASKKEIVEQSGSYIFQAGRVVTFNDEVAASMEFDAGFEGAVVAGPLTALVRKLKEEELELEPSDGELLIKGDKKKSGLRYEAEIVLPVEAIEQPEKWRKVPEGLLAALADAVEAASTDESQFVITCVNIAPEWVEATDNFQLLRCPCKTGLKKATLVKRGSLRSIASMQPTHWAETENWMHWKNKAGLVLSCRRYAEEYPPLDSYLDFKGDKTEMPKGLEEVIEKAVIFSNEDGGGSNLTVELRKGKCRLTGRGPNGWYSETRDVKYSGGETKFIIASRLLLQVLKHNEPLEIATGRLRVKTERGILVACAGLPEEE